MKQTLKSYHELITNLEERLGTVNRLHAQRDSLKAETEEHKSQREKLLAGAVADTSEEAIDRLAKHNARHEVFAVKLKHIDGQVEQAEEALQHCLLAGFLQPFKILYGALMRHRFERSKDQIAKLIVPERLGRVASLVEQLARHSRDYVDGQALEFYIGEGAYSRLHEIPGRPQIQTREGTLKILFNAVESAIEGGKRLVAVAEAEKGFTPPEIASERPAAATVEVKEIELAEAR
jgi:vacuolar-type H+-ATPase subunit E/Vma4